jgi:hypothetical protein
MMKKLTAALLALVMALALTGCTMPQFMDKILGKEPEVPKELGTIKTLNLIRTVEATDFPVDKEFADRKITRFQLATGLQEAAQTVLTTDEGAQAGLAPEQKGYWTRAFHLEGTPTGYEKDDLWLELTCGLTEDVIRVTAHKGEEWGACYVRGHTLYETLRHWRDRTQTIDEELYAKYKEFVDRGIEELYQREKAAGQPYTGWELTRFEWQRSHEDPTDDSTIRIYAVDFVMLTDHPEQVDWIDDMMLDSQGRVENVGNMGRMAIRYWWWGEKYETAFLPTVSTAESELDEARQALNENNPRT